MDVHTTRGGHSVRINISSQWDDGTDAEFWRRTDPPHSCLVVSDVTRSQGYISNVDAHAHVLASDTVRWAPYNVILCR